MTDLQLEMDMNCVEKLNEDQKIAFLKAFSRLAAADGKFDADEKAFIKNVGVTFGISPKRVNEILKIDNDDEILEEVKKIDNRRAALELIKEMCVLAHADDELSDEETAFIRRRPGRGADGSRIREFPGHCARSAAGRLPSGTFDRSLSRHPHLGSGCGQGREHGL